jgi:menaquinone-9 beta-reductase
LMLLEPIFRACEKEPEARRTLLETFTGDAPVYSLLKHPRMLTRALQDSVKDRIRS